MELGRSEGSARSVWCAWYHVSLRVVELGRTAFRCREAKIMRAEPGKPGPGWVVETRREEEEGKMGREGL